MRGVIAAALLWLPVLTLVSCGGGEATTAVEAAPATDAGLLAIAEQLYAGTPRVPQNFYTDPPPADAPGVVLTMHLKNRDVDPAAANDARYELCSDDLAEALAWSELAASYQGSYADLVSTDGDTEKFEFIRVPRADGSVRLRHRVFKCSYLDRSASDLDAADGSAGRLNLRPIDIAAARTAAEYLWQFTDFNNADRMVTASEGSLVGAVLRHDIEMAVLIRGGVTGGCDRIDLVTWRHSVDTATGEIWRELLPQRSFAARRSNGVVTLCQG